MQRFKDTTQVAVVVFVGATRAEFKQSNSLILAGWVSLFAGLLKELGDYLQVLLLFRCAAFLPSSRLNNL